MEAISTETQPIITTTTRLLSLELGDLMPLINDNPAFEVEDQTYLGAAVTLVNEALELKRKDDFAGAMKAVSKALKRISELVTLRNEVNPDYKVLEAPFIYQQANILTSYIETKSDVFGNVPELQIEESESESESEDQAEGEGQEAAGAAEGEANPAENNEKEEAPENADAEEPKIEDEAVKPDQEEEKQDGEAAGEQGEQGASMADDAIENFQAAIQLIEDFVNSPQAPSNASVSRKKIFSNLLIDTYSRFGDILQFKEFIPEAIANMKLAVDLCSEFPDGNERCMASTLYMIGCLF